MEVINFDLIILGYILLLALYFLVSEYYIVRRLNIKRTSNWTFAKERQKIFIVSEGIIFIIFIFITFALLEHFPNSSLLIGLPISILFFLQNFLRGIEKWLEKKSDRDYYHEWFASIIFLIMIVFVIFLEMMS